MGGGGGKSSGGNRSSRKARFSRRDARAKSKIAGKTLKGRLQANFSQKQLSSLKTQHASFKSHQKAGTLSTHQKKYSTGSYALSGAQRAQLAAREKIAKSKISDLKNTATKQKLKIDTSFLSRIGDTFQTVKDVNNPINQLGKIGKLFTPKVADGTLDAHKGRYGQKLPGDPGYERKPTQFDYAGDISNFFKRLNPTIKHAQTLDKSRTAYLRKDQSEGFDSEDNVLRRGYEAAQVVQQSISDLLGSNQKLDIGDVRNIPTAWGTLGTRPKKIPRLKAGFFRGDLFGIPNYVTSDLLAKGIGAAIPSEDSQNFFSKRYPDTARTLATLQGLGEGEAAKHIGTLKNLAAKYTGVKTAVTNPLQTIKKVFQPSTAGGKIRVKTTDPNKIGSVNNPYLESGMAAQDEQDLTAFWQRQNQINAAAEQRLKDIQSDRSSYNELLSSLSIQDKAYSDELARIQPIGQSYSDELARIQPIGKIYSDELARLQPFDKQFTSALADYTKGRDELRGYQKSGEYTHPDDVKFLNEELPQYDKAISDLEKQYKEYQTSLSELTKGQKDYQSYLGDIQAGQKDYKDYLGKIQTGQTELGAYRTDITKRQSELEDYSKAFTSAKEASDQAAKSYTIRAQQNISSGLRSGISGIRAQGGFRTIGSDKTRSPKRRFNRDFRIGSFGNEARIQPINI
tara:strand:- start:43 stop:2085 length:2043 start_codon:yes stop_codon:yes gene_type:complete